MTTANLPELRLSEISFSDGSKHDIIRDDIIVFVGPNNSGKSASLKELYGHIINGRASAKRVLTNVQFVSESTKYEVRKWLQEISKKDSRGDQNASFIGSYYESRVLDDWDDRHAKGLGTVARALVLHLTTEERLKLASPTVSIDVAFDVPTHPLHKMFIDEDFENL